jgi:hypothetical protein
VKLLTLCLVLSLSSCVTKKQIQAATWLNNFHAIPHEFCGDTNNRGPLWNYGFFRRLNDGRLQFISICTEQAGRMFTTTEEDYRKLLDAATGSSK